MLFCELPPEWNKEKYGKIIQYDEAFDTHNAPQHDSKSHKHVEESKDDQHDDWEDEIEIDNDGELVEKAKPPINDDQFFDEQPQDDGDDPYEGFDNDDLLMMLLEGKPVRGLKLNKTQRRDIKFAVKRGEVLVY